MCSNRQRRQSTSAKPASHNPVINNPDISAAEDNFFKEQWEQTRFQCRHIFTRGHRCGSPCLRGEDFCYHHHTSRPPVANLRQRRAHQDAHANPGPGLQNPEQNHDTSVPLALPLLEDRDSIRLAVGQIVAALAQNPAPTPMDIRRAGMMLYGLQIANCTLPRVPINDAHANKGKEIGKDLVEDVVVDPDLGVIAPQTEFNEPKQNKSSLHLVLENMQQHDQLLVANSKIRELEARLRQHETPAPAPSQPQQQPSSSSPLVTVLSNLKACIDPAETATSPAGTEPRTSGIVSRPHFRVSSFFNGTLPASAILDTCRKHRLLKKLRPPAPCRLNPGAAIRPMTGRSFR